MIHAQMGQPVGVTQVRMGQQRAYGLQHRGLSPDWPSEGESIPCEFPSDTARTNATCSRLRNDGYGPQSYSCKSIRAVLGTRFVRRVSWIACHQRVPNIFQRIPSERRRRIASSPRTKQRLAEAFGGGYLQGLSPPPPRRRRRLPWNSCKPFEKMLMALSEEQTEAGSIDPPLFVVLDSGVAHQRCQKVSSLSEIDTRCACLLAEEIPAFLLRIVEILAAIKIMR